MLIVVRNKFVVFAADPRQPITPTVMTPNNAKTGVVRGAMVLMFFVESDACV